MNHLRVARIVAIASAVYFILHGLYVITAPEHTVMSWLYDDCFYYLITAKHLFEQHISSFDGITVTSGYHPLWAWICVSVYGLHNKLDITYVRLCMGVSLLISSLVLVAALRRSLPANFGWLWALGLGATSYSALNNGITIMEWPLVIVFWTLMHLLLLRQSDPHCTRSRLITLCAASAALGFAGSLSRTDFGLIPAAYVAAGTFIGYRYHLWRPFKAALWAVSGSAVGLGCVMAYNRAMTGSWAQQSVQVKHLLASTSTPFNPAPAAWQFARALLYLPPLDLSQGDRTQLVRYGVLALVGCSLAAIAAIIYLVRRRSARKANLIPSSPQEALGFASAIFGIAGYLILYSFNSQGTFGWYSATVTGFVLLLAARAFTHVGPRIAAACALPLIALNIAVGLYGGPTAGGQYQEVRTGRVLHRDHPNSLMAGGDVGKPSFYNGGTMINLDGLMNNEVYPYLTAGNFPCYFLVRHIEYLSDVGGMTVPIVDAERTRHHLPALNWAKIFVPRSATDDEGFAATYLQTDFAAIQNLGECPAPHH